MPIIAHLTGRWRCQSLMLQAAIQLTHQARFTVTSIAESTPPAAHTEHLKPDGRE